MRIKAKHIWTGKVVYNLEYKSIKEAKYYNPYLIDFEEIL